MCEDLTDKGLCLGQQGREVSGLLVSCTAFGPCFPLFGRKDVSLPPGTGGYFHGEMYFQLQGEQKKGSVCFLHQLFLKSLYFRAISVLQWSVLG